MHQLRPFLLDELRISSETSERPSASRRNLYSRSKSSCIMMWSEIIRGA